MKFARLAGPSTLLIVFAAGAAFLTRLSLFLVPGAGGSTILGVHVHHLLIGVLLVCIGGIPAILLRSDGFLRRIAVALFGAGVGLALDEWVLFVIREGSPDASYMTPPAVAGAVTLVVLFILYVIVVERFAMRNVDDLHRRR